MTNNTTPPAPEANPVHGFITGKTAEVVYQAHRQQIRAGCYVVHLPSGKVGQVTCQGGERHTWGVAWDSEYKSTELRRITPAQYKAMPDELKIVSPETGIF